MADAPPAPMDFRELTTARTILVVDPEFEASVRTLGLPEPAAIADLFSSAPAEAGRSATARVALPGHVEHLQLRRVVHGGALGRLWGHRLLGLARPISELRVTAALRGRGAAVPRPIVVAGWRAAPLWSAVFGTLHIDDTLDGVAWLATLPATGAIADACAAAGRAVKAFHDAGGHHADLHVKNLLLRTRDGAPEAFVIDLDKARAGAPPDARRRMRELARLYRSLLKRGLTESIGESGRCAFLDAYLDGDHELGRALLRHWPAERRRVARHALGYGASS